MSGQIKKILAGQVCKRISGQLKENMQYRDKLQEIIDYHNIEDHKKTYQQMYKNILNASAFQKRLDAIPYSPNCQ